MKIFLVLTALCALACGSNIRKSAPRLDGRIVGGRSTDISEIPYQLSLMSYGSHICGASIISANWALTAAHCVDGSSASSVSVRAGSSIRNSGGQVYNVRRIIVHPRFDSWTIDYDYALLELAKPIKLGSNAQPVGLAASEPSANSQSIASGWGTLSSGGNLPSQLQSVSLPIVDRKVCQQKYSGNDITSRMICAGVVDVGGKDSCQGDSGGPLVSGGRQVGIVSWGIGCASRNYPGVYTNVAAQRDWIRQQTGL